MTEPTPILIAGIGNIFLGDDAFGVEVAQRLLRRPMPPGVRVVDFGIRGIDLTYALLDGCDTAILVDAVSRGQPPGTVFLIEPQPQDDAPIDEGIPLLEAHNLDPARVLALVRSQGGKVRRVLLVGCEPSPVDPEMEMDMQMEMSPAVVAAVDRAIEMIDSLVAEILEQSAVVDGFSSGLVRDTGVPPVREPLGGNSTEVRNEFLYFDSGTVGTAVSRPKCD